MLADILSLVARLRAAPAPAALDHARQDIYIRRSGMHREKQIGCVSIALGSRQDELPLPKPVKSAILAANLPGIWRMSDQTTGSQGQSCFPTVLEHVTRPKSMYLRIVSW
jgi:hypothetical protein